MKTRLTPRFYLDNSKLDESFVMMSLTLPDGRLKYSTGLKISPKNWPSDNDRNKLSDGDLKALLSKIYILINLHSRVGHLTCKQQVKDLLDAELGRKSKNVTTKVITGSFENVTNDIIKQMKTGQIRNLKTGLIYAKASIAAMSSARDVLLQFQKAKGKSVDFDKVTEETLRWFIEYLNEHEYRQTTIACHVGYWKVLAKNARKKVPVSKFFDDKDFKVATEIPEKVILHDYEIEKLMKLKLTGSDEIIRDRFICNSENGLRISDWRRVSNEDIKDGILSFITQKKNKKVAIPLGPHTRLILKKYGGRLPDTLSQYQINRRIKVIAELAGINDVINFTETIGGKLVKQSKKKFELITNHTCRRTTATNFSLNGIQDSDVNNLLAMSINTYMRYKKVSPIDTAEKVKNNPLFK